jgi:serine/threonine protein kinase
MMIIQFAEKGNLRTNLSNNFNNIMWKYKIKLLCEITYDLNELHKSGYIHKDFHNGNILQINTSSYISDFGLSGPANVQKSDDKVVYGVLPYIAPEVLNGEPYTPSADIYSVGIVMTELSSGKPPFYNKKHDLSLSLAICNGLRPEFGKGTPEFYKKLAYKCMNVNSNERPTAEELKNIFGFWYDSIKGYRDEVEKFGYKGEEIKAAFEEADKEIPNISTSYEKNSNAIYTSRAFTFSHLLSKPVNSSIITSYVNNEDSNEGIFYFKIFIYLFFKIIINNFTITLLKKGCDSQLVNMEISNSIKLGGTIIVIIYTF